MKDFAKLFKELDETNKSTKKIILLKEYFETANPSDAIWVINFLIGRKPKQVVPVKKLTEWCLELAQLPEWMFMESLDAVGDLAETITLLLPFQERQTDIKLNVLVDKYLLPLRKADEATQKKIIIELWTGMNSTEKFVFNKLITGSFRVGVSINNIVKALALQTGITEAVISHRLMGNWIPTGEFYNTLISQTTSDADVSKPYPFYLAYQIDKTPEELGDTALWQAEWKWDGIRSQIIKRNSEVYIWSRGEDLITERFPELKFAALNFPDGTVIDGEIMAWQNNHPLPFAELQKRIGRKNLTKKILEEVPIKLVGYDIIEYNSEDIRDKTLAERRKILVQAVKNLNDEIFIVSPVVEYSSWDELRTEREKSRNLFVEGIMLKRKDSQYKTGRKKGDWWKWKIDPLSVDAVLIYAQKGSGKRANLFTDYTFGIWKEDKLVPFAKAYSGLTDEEIKMVDDFVKKNTVEKFGPVRIVKPELVFEIAFDAIQISSRHKSGIAVRFPRILRWRTDKKIEDADTLENVKGLIRA